MALLLAVPFGVGGLCCCLTDGMGQEVMAEIRADPPPASCCTKSEPAPATTGGECPDEEECACPSVSDATLASRTSDVTVAVGLLGFDSPAGSHERIEPSAPIVAVAPLAHSPPKIPLYLAHSVFRS
jgi:hypothetical protein